MCEAISSLSQMKIAETASKYGPGFPAGKLPERFVVGQVVLVFAFSSPPRKR
jgi:hypothetical protein